MKSKRYIEFKIETAENMTKGKVVLLTHPQHRLLLSKLLFKLQQELTKYKGEDNNA